MQTAGGRAKSVMQGSFLPGKSSVFKTTCFPCPVRTELWCDLARDGFVRSSFQFQRVLAWGRVMLAGASLTVSYMLGLCRFNNHCSWSWKLLSACSKDKKYIYMSWLWIPRHWRVGGSWGLLEFLGLYFCLRTLVAACCLLLKCSSKATSLIIRTGSTFHL